MRKIFISFSFLLFFSLAEGQNSYHNPIIPGFHPDPSICRVGDDFYLVTSSFEYFPGVPVFHSKDLIHWEQIGHCLTRKNQLNLDHAWSSGGIYAPTIRYNNGTFYMITTNVARGNFIVSTKDPAGEWSDPVWIDQGGIDPSLFFDDDGKVYYTGNNPGGGNTEGIYMFQIDVNTGQKLSAVKKVWDGTGGRYPEGPHLYKINGLYYLMIAEGGTEYGHNETIARSKSPWGPYESCPHNPIITHRGVNAQNNPIQGTGHADICQAADGSWWMVCLAFRPVSGYWHQLGRETFLAPVNWENGWPVVNGNGTISLEMKAKTLPTVNLPVVPARDEFDKDKLALYWNFLRNPEPSRYSLTQKPGWLVMKGSSLTLDSIASPTFIGRRQEQFRSECVVKLNFKALKPSDRAGLTALMNDHYHYEIAITKDSKGQSQVELTARLGRISTQVSVAPIGREDVWLKINSTSELYKFSYSVDGKSYKTLGTLDSKFLSSEVAGGFTGVYYGVFVEGDCTAFADWFEYKNLE